MIGSATSCMERGPMSLSRIHPSICILKPMKNSAKTIAMKAIRFEAAEETKVANNRIATGPDATATILKTNIESVLKWR